jgi:hypothetical protein
VVKPPKSEQVLPMIAVFVDFIVVIFVVIDHLAAAAMITFFAGK